VHFNQASAVPVGAREPHEKAGAGASSFQEGDVAVRKELEYAINAGNRGGAL